MPATKDPSATSVAIVGGSVIGLAAAWRLAQQGYAVTVFDAAELPSAAGAAWVAGGMLGAYSESGPDEFPSTASGWGDRLLDAWDRQIADLGAPEIYACRGALHIAIDQDDADCTATVIRHSPPDTIAPAAAAEVSTLAPGLTKKYTQAAYCEREAAIDNRRLLTALWTQAQALGALHEQTNIAASADLLELSQRFDKVILAAGIHSSVLVPSIQLRSIKGEIFRLQRRPGTVAAPDTCLRIRIHGNDLYIVPRPEDDGVVIGATQYEAADDTLPKADGVRQLLNDLAEAYPGMERYALTDVMAGMRPRSLDGAPVLGPIPTELLPGEGWKDNVLAATGHGRHGILWSALTAELLAAWIGGETPAVVADLAPARPQAQV